MLSAREAISIMTTITGTAITPLINRAPVERPDGIDRGEVHDHADERGERDHRVERLGYPASLR